MSNPTQAGKKFSLANDNKILEFKSPKDRVGGPYVVVHEDSKHRWAIVAMNWTHGRKTKPVPGIRWLHDKVGYPQSNKHPAWLVVPKKLRPAILDSLQLSPKYSHLINDFLEGRMMGEELRDKWYA